MELKDVMRTTFAAREFTGEDVPDAVIHDLIETRASPPRAATVKVTVLSSCATQARAMPWPPWRSRRQSVTWPNLRREKAPGTR